MLPANSGLSPLTDNILQFVSKNFISLQDDHKKANMGHFSLVLTTLVNLIKEKDKLFNAIYQELYWAGSYFDGLKVGKAEEYDVDVVMKLPINYKEVKFINKKVDPPFIQVDMSVMDKLKQHPEWTNVYRFMESWTDNNGLLLQRPFRQWMESAVNKALDVLPKENGARKLVINGTTYLITLSKTGPAMTLYIILPNKTKIDVDLVPVFEFKYPEQWPNQPVRRNTIPSRGSWLIVPKPNSKKPAECKDTYWRLAFQEQEREMINDKGRLKPVCRLLKKLRDENSALHSIASYYLKTLFLWDILAKKNDPTYWTRISLSSHFMDMLKMLHKHLVKGTIPYFWDERYNLLSGISDIELYNCEKRVEKIIKDIENKSMEDPKIIAKYILANDEFSQAVDSLNTIGGVTRNPPVMSGKEYQESGQADVNTEQADNVVSLASVMEVLKTMQQELVQQRKITQTVLAKISALQQSVDQLTDDNSLLRDELKLITKQSPKMNLSANKEIDLLDLLSIENTPTHGNFCSATPLLN